MPAKQPIILKQKIIEDDELRRLLQAARLTDNTVDFFEKFEYHFPDQPSATLRVGEELLRKCKELAPEAYKGLHKGTPFYWLACAAFLVHDYETATFYIDAAVSEDISKGSADPTESDTPALKFIYIKGAQPEQAARPLVLHMEMLIKNAISDYNNRPGRPDSLPTLTLDDIRRHFLRHVLSSSDRRLRTLATTFISFFLEWNHRSKLSELGTDKGTAEPFFIHLFKGCLLFESLLKENPEPPTGTTLGRVLTELAPKLGIPKINVHSKDFASILSGLTTRASISAAIERTGKIRNTLGHNLGWPASLDTPKYNALVSDVASSCLHAINCLYRQLERQSSLEPSRLTLLIDRT